jgi:hypothetical protein
MAIQVVRTLAPTTVDHVRHHLDTLKDRLVPDVSTYAVGRQRFWLQAEGPLSQTGSFKLGVIDHKLWEWCLRVFPGAQLGLAAYGPVGIRLHRDTSYADYEAVSINLGEVGAWLYDDQYPAFNAWAPAEACNTSDLRDMALPVGAVTRFNCKNPHQVVDPAEDRWSINLWRVSRKYRLDWATFHNINRDVL